jgi:hypothetical protein
VVTKKLSDDELRAIRGMASTLEFTKLSERMDYTIAALHAGDQFGKATDHFEDSDDAFDSERRPEFNEAVEELRQMARLNPTVLQRREVSK